MLPAIIYKCERTLWSNNIISLLIRVSDTQLAIGRYGDENVYLYNFNGDAPIIKLIGHDAVVTVLVALKRGFMASGSADKTVRIWDLTKHTLVGILSGHTKDVMALAVLQGGRILASGSKDNTVKLWDIKKMECINTFSGHTRPVTALILLSEGSLASGSKDNTLRLWPTNDKIGSVGAVHAMVALPGMRLAYSSSSPMIKIIDIETKENTKSIDARRFDSPIALVTDNLIVYAPSDNTVEIYNLQTNECEYVLQGHTTPVNAIAVLPGGQLATGDGSRVRIWTWDVLQYNEYYNVRHGLAQRKPFSRSRELDEVTEPLEKIKRRLLKYRGDVKVLTKDGTPEIDPIELDEILKKNSIYVHGSYYDRESLLHVIALAKEKGTVPRLPHTNLPLTLREIQMIKDNNIYIVWDKRDNNKMKRDQVLEYYYPSIINKYNLKNYILTQEQWDAASRGERWWEVGTLKLRKTPSRASA
jgi:WD40 repeat protein